ncbi:MAG: hypothetical protein GY950_11545 [bacterium]|nr:hypothetical protein [bacterium]
MPGLSYREDGFGIDAKNTSGDLYFSGAAVYIKPLSKKTVLGIALYETPIMGVKWNPEEMKNLSGGEAVQWRTFLGAATLTPGISYKLSDIISLGAALNIVHARWNLKKPSYAGQFSERFNGFGVGASVGLLLKSFRDSVTFGVTFKTPVKIKLSGNSSVDGLLSWISTESKAEREITLPMWIGVGVALKSYKRLMATADVHYTRWASFGVIKTSYTAPGWAGAHEAVLELNWKSTVQVRVGLQYLASKTLTLRAGYATQPTPAAESPNNILLPTVNSEWFSLGFGYSRGKLTIDAGVSLALRREKVMEIEDIPFGTLEMSAVVPTVSLTYIF